MVLIIMVMPEVGALLVYIPGHSVLFTLPVSFAIVSTCVSLYIICHSVHRCSIGRQTCSTHGTFTLHRPEPFLLGTLCDLCGGSWSSVLRVIQTVPSRITR